MTCTIGIYPPYINIFYEVGHLIDENSPGGNYYTNMLSSEKRSWITNEGLIDVNVLIGPIVYDPNTPNGADALQGTKYTGPTPNEQWADTFANYVAGNINTSPSGVDMTMFVYDLFYP